MHKYLYLTKNEWILNWVNGGVIPIQLASTYRSDVREGTKTPDENRVHRSNVDLKSLEPYIVFGDDVSVKGFSLINVTPNAIGVENIYNAKYFIEDGLILSFCNRKSASIAKKLGKVACVKILDIHNLKRIIDDQLGVEGIIGDCEYTSDHNRDHFLKSDADSWQDEYRIFWPVKRNAKVVIPSGIAKSVKLKI